MLNLPVMCGEVVCISPRKWTGHEDFLFRVNKTPTHGLAFGEVCPWWPGGGVEPPTQGFSRRCEIDLEPSFWWGIVFDQLVYGRAKLLGKCLDVQRFCMRRGGVLDCRGLPHLFTLTSRLPRSFIVAHFPGEKPEVF